eukprot:6072655-Amphidinium_carterae.1
MARHATAAELGLHIEEHAAVLAFFEAQLGSGPWAVGDLHCALSSRFPGWDTPLLELGSPLSHLRSLVDVFGGEYTDCTQTSAEAMESLCDDVKLAQLKLQIGGDSQVLQEECVFLLSCLQQVSTVLRHERLDHRATLETATTAHVNASEAERQRMLARIDE